MAHSDHSAFDQFWLFWVVFYCKQFVAEGTSGSFSLCSLSSCMQVLRRDPVCWRKTFHAWYVQGRERERERQRERERDVASNLPDKCELALRSIVGLERGEVLKQKALWWLPKCHSDSFRYVARQTCLVLKLPCRLMVSKVTHLRPRTETQALQPLKLNTIGGAPLVQAYFGHAQMVQDASPLSGNGFMLPGSCWELKKHWNAQYCGRFGA